MSVRQSTTTAILASLLAAAALAAARGDALAGPVADTALPAAAPLPAPLWHRRLIHARPETSRVARWVLDAERYLRQHQEPVIPPFHPIRATLTRKNEQTGKTESVPLIVYRSYWGVHAVRLLTGELEWECRMAWDLEPRAESSTSHWTESWMSFYAGNGQQAAGRRPGIVFDNTAVGYVSGDDTYVYAIDDLQVPPPTARTEFSPHLYFPHESKADAGNSLFGHDPQVLLDDAIRHSRLQTIEIATGKLKRELGDPARDTHLADDILLGPPAVVGNRLYQASLKKTVLPGAALAACPALSVVPLDRPSWEMDLLVFEAGESGKLLSRQPLTVVAGVAYPFERRMHAFPLQVAGNLIVCPTDAGVVIGFDRTANRRSWSYDYFDQADAPAATPDIQPGSIWEVPVWQKPAWWTVTPWWKAPGLTVRGNKAILTAADSRYVHCLNVRDGSLAWKVPQDAGDRYVAGVTADTVLVVGKRSVRGLRLDTGATAWTLASDLPSGQGAIRDGLLYLPLWPNDPDRPAEIRVIDATSGRVVARFALPKDAVPGNLAFVDDRLVSVSTRAVTVYRNLAVKTHP